MEQASAANTRKQNTGNSTGGGQQSNNEGGGNKGMRKQGSNAGQGKFQHQTSSGSQASGQTKQTQNQQQQQSTPKSTAPQTGKERSSKLPEANDWGFLQKMTPKPEPQTVSNANNQGHQAQKSRSNTGKRSNHDKQQSVDSKENRSKRQNGKGQLKADGKSIDELACVDDAIITTSSNQAKSKGRDLVKYVPEELPQHHQTLAETDNKEIFDQFQDKKKSTYSDSLYSTALDMKKLDKKTIEKGKQIEDEINQSSARNRHMLEERGQLELRDEDEDDNEETKYSAVDTMNQNQAAMGKLDGIRMKKTAPSGKFKTFHKKIDKKALDVMTSTFLKNLPKKGGDTLLAPASQQATPSVQARQQIQAPIMMNPVGQGPMNFNPQPSTIPPPNPNINRVPQPQQQNPFPSQGMQTNTQIFNPFDNQKPSGMKTDIAEFKPTTQSTPFNPQQMQMPKTSFAPNNAGGYQGQNPQSSLSFGQNRQFNPNGPPQFQMQQPQQNFQSPMQNNYPPPQYNSQQQYGGGGYQHQGQGNFHKRNQPPYSYQNQHPQNSMPLPGGQPNMMHQPPMQNNFQPGSFTGGGQTFTPQMQPPKMASMPMPNNPASANNAPQSTLPQGQQPYQGQQPPATGQPSDEAPTTGSNPFASFVSKSGTFQPTQK